MGLKQGGSVMMPRLRSALHYFQQLNVQSLNSNFVQPSLISIYGTSIEFPQLKLTGNRPSLYGCCIQFRVPFNRLSVARCLLIYVSEHERQHIHGFEQALVQAWSA